MVNPDSAVVRGARQAVRACLGPLARARGFVVHHPERVPVPGRWLLCCNHAAFADSVFLHLAVPVDLAVCGGHPRLFRTPARRALMALGNVRQVDGETSFHRAVTRQLGTGRPVLVYPEGGRNPKGLGPFRTWAAEAALKHGAPIVPCYLWGTTAGHDRPVRLAVGQTLRPSGDPLSLTQRLRSDIEALAQEFSS